MCMFPTQQILSYLFYREKRRATEWRFPKSRNLLTVIICGLQKTLEGTVAAPRLFSSVFDVLIKTKTDQYLIGFFEKLIYAL